MAGGSVLVKIEGEGGQFSEEEAWEGEGRWGNICGEGRGAKHFLSGPKFPPNRERERVTLHTRTHIYIYI